MQLFDQINCLFCCTKHHYYTHQGNGQRTRISDLSGRYIGLWIMEHGFNGLKIWNKDEMDSTG